MTNLIKRPTVSVINGVYTFTDLNPELPYFGLSEDEYYQLCLNLLEVVGGYHYHGYIRNALNRCKADPDIADGDEAASSCDGELIWEGCNVKTDLKELRKFLPDKADRKAVLWNWPNNDQLIFPDGDLAMDVEDEKYRGAYFDYDTDHEFSWTLSGMDFFEFAYNYEVTHSI